MAKLIHTGEMEAITLKHLHGHQVKAIDDAAEQMIEKNGGYAWLKLWLKRGIFDLVEVCESVSLRPKKHNKIA